MSGQGLGIKNTALSSSYVEYIEKQRMFGTPLTSSSSITPLLDDSLGTGPKTPSSPFLQSYKRGRGRAYRRLEWYSTVGIFATGIYSTLLSGVWLVIALKKPHWGSFINSNGSVLTPATASTLATAIAKTIEISFLTFFLAMMGQYLTRRAASDQNASGISLADLQLKVLLVLPGTLFTQWRNYGRSLRSMLGVISLIACFSAMLYTTASDSVVSPKPNTSSVIKSLSAEISTTPGLIDYIKKDCPDDNKDDCMIVKDAGLAYINFIQYLTTWQQSSGHDLSISSTNRPPPVAVFNGNVSVQGSWVDQSDMAAASQTYNRTITNVSMAMPHAGLVKAAAFRDNKLPQVDNINLDTSLDIDAKTVVPVLNVLCAEASKQELSPLIYNQWPHYNRSASAMSMGIDIDWYNSTVLDRIFGFRRVESPPPVFYRIPGTNNSLLNGNWHAAGALYLLLASQVGQQVEYSVCGMSFNLRGRCSSEFSTSASGSLLKSNCMQHDMSYDQPVRLAQNSTPASWAHASYSWAEAIALGAGNFDANASIPTILSEYITQGSSFDPKRPSMVESLAVLAANTLLDSMVDAPFDGSWPYQTQTLESPAMQSFTARVSTSDYTSGVQAQALWQNVFIVVLAAVFVLNVAFFGYLLYISAYGVCMSRFRWMDPSKRGLRMDCTDLSEVFQIALNSPHPGKNSPVGAAQRSGTLRSMRWHFRDGAPSSSPDGLDGLRLAFDKDENYGMTSPGQDYFTSPRADNFGLSKRGNRAYTPVSFEESTM